MSRTLAVTVAVALVGCAAAPVAVRPTCPEPEPAPPHGLAYTNQGAPVHWAPEDLPLQLLVADDMPVTHLASLLVAVGTVHEALGAEVFHVLEVPADVLPGDLAVPDGMCTVETVPELPGTRAGVTAYWADLDASDDPGHMSGCKVRVRQDLTPEYMYGTMTHELGHVLGLVDLHKNPADIMFWKLAPTPELQLARRFNPRAMQWLADRL